MQSTIFCALLALPIAANADGVLCPKPGEKAIVTHPTDPKKPPETRIRCGKQVTPDVIDVPPTTSSTAPSVAPSSPPTVRIVREVVVKRVFIPIHRVSVRHRETHGGLFDSLGAIFHPHHGG
jgi:hypothetical protein